MLTLQIAVTVFFRGRGGGGERRREGERERGREGEGERERGKRDRQRERQRETIDPFSSHSPPRVSAYIPPQPSLPRMEGGTERAVRSLNERTAAITSKLVEEYR